MEENINLHEPLNNGNTDFRGNAINEISLALCYDMFQFSKSATFLILQKMHTYESFNQFLAEACDENIKDFVPELVPESKTE